MTDLDQLSAAATHDTTKEGVEREVCNPIIAYVSDGRGMPEWRLAKIIDVSRALVAEIKRLNDWADGFSDVQQKERKLAEARIAEMVTLAAHEAAIEAAVLKERERCAAYCESTEMGISPKSGGEYTPCSSTCFQEKSGTHPGMGYARAIREATP